MKKIIITILATILILSISGCGAGPIEVKPLKKVDDVSMKFNFPDYDSVNGEKLSFNDFNFSNDFYKMSSYHKFSFREAKQNEKYYDGLKIEKKDNSYIFKYLRGHLRDDMKDIHGESIENWYLSEVVFKINFVSKDKNVIFTLEPNYKYKPMTDSIGIPIKPLAPFDKLEADMRKIFSQLYKLTDAKAKRKLEFTFSIPTSNTKNKIYNNMLNDSKYGVIYFKEIDLVVQQGFHIYIIKHFTDKTFVTPLLGKINYEIVSENNKNILKCSGVLEYTIDTKGTTTASPKYIYYAIENIREVINRTDMKYHQGTVKIKGGPKRIKYLLPRYFPR